MGRLCHSPNRIVACDRSTLTFMTKPRDMYDLSVELADPPEVKALMEQAKAFAQKACKVRSGSKVAKLAKAFAERKARR